MNKDRKREITEAALKVFCEKGFEATTIDDISKKAKCSHGLFYHYFKTKKELYNSVLEIANAEKISKLWAEINATENYVEKLKIFLTDTFNSVKKDEIFSYFFYFTITRRYHFKESNIIPPKPLENIKEGKLKPMLFALIDLFRNGQEKGYFSKKGTPEEYATILNNIINGTIVNYIITPKKFIKNLPTPNVDLILDFFSKGDHNEEK
ncbi:MAG: TetR/AcrR family transcriptional regulator [Clostridia bacterium]|nr:TetR/AcrR family transcriptional regulator [Clostridia bacterium]